MRYCEKCTHIKPDRAHHCSVCGTCVLKMDHHCPWVNNCVSFTNYKFFILFLGYAFLYCLFIVLTTLKYIIRFWKVNNEECYVTFCMLGFTIQFKCRVSRVITSKTHCCWFGVFRRFWNFLSEKCSDGFRGFLPSRPNCFLLILAGRPDSGTVLKEVEILAR